MIIEFSLCVVCFFDNVSWVYSVVVCMSYHKPSSMCVGVTCVSAGVVWYPYAG